METYFHNDPRIVKWIDQITEKVFTVCLLTGADADLEFQRGSQIVTKVSEILLGISMFPSELLENGLRQLLEQQLPDDHVIENFPTFHDIMDKMLHEGIAKALEGQQDSLKNENGENKIGINEKEIIAGTENIINEVNNQKSEDVQGRIIAEENQDFFEIYDILESGDSENVDKTVDKIVDKTIEKKIINEITIRAFSADNCLINNHQENKLEGSFQEDVGRDGSDLEQKSLESDAEQDFQEVSRDTVHLKYVLGKIFPNSSVRWDVMVNNQKFDAQIDNILICFSDSVRLDFSEEILRKEGWKVIVCAPEDLLFPRRLEREIREIVRSGKRSLIV